MKSRTCGKPLNIVFEAEFVHQSMVFTQLICEVKVLVNAVLEQASGA